MRVLPAIIRFTIYQGDLTVYGGPLRQQFSGYTKLVTVPVEKYQRPSNCGYKLTPISLDCVSVKCQFLQLCFSIHIIEDQAFMTKCLYTSYSNHFKTCLCLVLHSYYMSMNLCLVPSCILASIYLTYQIIKSTDRISIYWSF